MTHVMIDIETLGTKPDAVIVQIGAVAFDLASGGKVHQAAAFNRYVDPDSCTRLGMSVEGRTVTWWMTQSDRARNGLVNGVDMHSVDIRVALADLIAWPKAALGINIGWENIEGVWAKPAPFDLPILKTAFDRALHVSPPWDRRREFDCRTVYHLIGGAPEVEPYGVAHDAVDDCVFQVCQLQVAMGLMKD